jgi:hypothetical protein
VRRTSERADSEGRLHFELDGDEYLVGVGPAAILALGDFEVQDARWATDGKPVRVRVRVWNRGAAPSSPTALRWETPNANVVIPTPLEGLPSIGAGKSANVALQFSVDDPEREVVKLYAVIGTNRLPLEIPTFPDAPAAQNFRIADGRELTVYQGGIKRVPLTLGKGNGDGQANPGETLAILLPDGDAWRAAELFTNDSCVDLAERVSDEWSDYDHVGASAKYSLPVIQHGCPPGHIVRMLARVQLPHAPDHRIEYFTVEFAVSGSRSATTK